MSAPIITPRFALCHLTDELDRTAAELSFVIHSIRSAIDSGDGDGALFILMHLRDKLESLSEYAVSAIKAQNGEARP